MIWPQDARYATGIRIVGAPFNSIHDAVINISQHCSAMEASVTDSHVAREGTRLGPTSVLRSRRFSRTRTDKELPERLRCQSRYRDSCASAGMTLVELLVGLSVVTILISLVVPAVLAVREKARKTECQSHLRKLGVACQEYQAIHQVFPEGRLFGRYGVGPTSRGWSWLARILPLVDQSALHDSGGIPHKSLEKSGVADAEVSLFLCPSDSERTPGPRMDAGNMIEHRFGVGQTNYKGVSGANWGADRSQSLTADKLESPWRNRGTNGSFDGLSNGDGMLYRDDYRRSRKPSHVRDGLSRTFMLGEDLPAHDAYCSWPYSNNAYSTCAIPPNVDGRARLFDWLSVQSFRSDHEGGLHFAYADGHVEFISEEIDLKIYRSLATIAGSETN